MERKLIQVKGRAFYTRQFIIKLSEIQRGCAVILVAGQHKQVLRTGERRVVQPPEVKELHFLKRLKLRSVVILDLDFTQQVFVGLTGRIAKRVHDNNRELHSLRLMYRHE